MPKKISEQQIRDILNEAGDRLKLSCSHVPIEISTRMRKTYGSFVFKIKQGHLTPVAFRFALKLVSGDYPEEIVRHTVLHEYAHFYINTISNENRGHDRAFKTTCLRLGISPDTHFQGNHQEKPRRGYRILCTGCQEEVAQRRRVDAAKSITQKYRSGCCQAKLQLKKDIF